jgi:hypothetical protein
VVHLTIPVMALIKVSVENGAGVAAVGAHVVGSRASVSLYQLLMLMHGVVITLTLSVRG